MKALLSSIKAPLGLYYGSIRAGLARLPKGSTKAVVGSTKAVLGQVSRDFHAHAGTPYTDPALNLNLKGRVLRTFLRGREVFRDDDAKLGHDPQHHPQVHLIYYQFTLI